MRKFMEGLAATVALASVAAVYHVLEVLVGPGLLLAFAAVGTTAAVAGNINEGMKIHFEDPMFENTVSDSELLDLFEKDDNVQESRTNAGRYIETAQYFDLPAGFGFRKLEGDYIPVPFGPTIKNSILYLKKAEFVAEMTGDTYRRVKNDRTAWVNWAKRHLKDVAKRGANEIDRVLHGYGSGIKARIAAGGIAGTTITVDRAHGVTGLDRAVLNFLAGESIVFGPNADGTALRDAGGSPSRRVVSVDIAAGTIEIDSAVPALTVADDYIFAGDDAAQSVPDAGVAREVMGLLGMIDDGGVVQVFQNLDRTTYPLWRGLVVDANVAATNPAPHTGELSEIILTYADDECAIQGMGDVDVIVTSRNGVRSFWGSLLSDRAINDPKSFTGGKKGVFILLGTKRVELRATRKMAPQLCYGITKGTLKRWASTDFEWDDTTGAIWNRVTDNVGRKDTFYAVGHMVFQTGCIAPAKNFRIENLQL